jgi:hypothetical protein
MKYFTDIFLRFIALVLLVTFTFVSCTNSFLPYTGSGIDKPTVIITPGEGNPCYVYIDSDGKITEDDQGRTALFVENNKNAKGVLIVSDKVESENRVSISNQNNNSIVSMFFKPGSNFPYQMVINQDNDIYYAYLSSYNSVNSTYDIVFEKDGEYESMLNLVLNMNVFSAYNNDPSLDSSQNLRLRNITIALGLWGSLYSSFDDQDTSPRAARGFFSSLVKGIKAVFKAVAVIATVVAVIVAPIVTFINPAAGAILAKAAKLVAAASTAIVVALTKVEQALDDKKASPKKPVVPGKPDDPDSPITIVLSVKNVYENYNSIINGSEFHIGTGKDVLLEFSMLNWDTASSDKLYEYFRSVEDIKYGYEPGNNTTPRNSSFFELTIDKNQAPDRFLVKIKRIDKAGFVGEGKVAFGFEIPGADELVVNGVVKEFTYKYEKDEPKNYKNMVLVWFCIAPDCPDK